MPQLEWRLLGEYHFPRTTAESEATWVSRWRYGPLGLDWQTDKPQETGEERGEALIMFGGPGIIDGITIRGPGSDKLASVKRAVEQFVAAIRNA